MRVLILGTRGVPARYGGFETYAENISLELLSLGCEVAVMNPHTYSVQGNNFRGVTILYSLCIENLFKGRYLRAASTILYDILSILKSCFSNYDVVLVCGYASGPALMLPIIFGKKVIINPDGFEWKSSRWGWIIRSWLRICEYISARQLSGLVADSVEIGRYFSEKFSIKPRVIEYGAKIIDSAPFPNIIREHSTYYLACARLVPETNIDMIINGFLKSSVRSSLIVIGPVTDTTYFREKVEPLIDGKKVIYLGSIYQEGILPAIRFHARALLHGHASDGTNPSLIESMGAGSPVIAIDRPSNRIPLTNKFPIFFKDDEELAQRIKYLDTLSEVDRKNIGEQNKEIVRSRFSWSSMAMKHLIFFKDVSGKL